MNVLVLTGSSHKNGTTAQLSALGCHEPTDLEGTDYLQRAFDMGYEL